MPPTNKMMPQDAGGKMTLETANYRGADDGGPSCSGCGNFQAPDHCNILSGKVDANGVCDLFTPKQNEAALMNMMFGQMGGMGGPAGGQPLG